MVNQFQDIDIKNWTYYNFDYIINIKNHDPTKSMIDEKSYKNVLIYYIEYLMFKDLESRNAIEINWRK